MEDKILTIEKVNFTGKWVEFWFAEEKAYKDKLNDDYEPTGEKEETWSKSSKSYMLWDAAESAGINSDVYNKGFSGRKLKWTHKSPNWELVEFV